MVLQLGSFVRDFQTGQGIPHDENHTSGIDVAKGPLPI